jgi:outer membrane protein assembly factor BamB
MTLDRHVGAVTCRECGRAWQGRGDGIAFCGWCGAYFGATEPRSDDTRRPPRLGSDRRHGVTAAAVAVAVVMAMLAIRDTGGRGVPPADSGVDLDARRRLAADSTDPGVGQTGPWCRTQTTVRADCTRWLTATIDDATIAAVAIDGVALRLTQHGAAEGRSLVDGAVLWQRGPEFGATAVAGLDGDAVMLGRAKVWRVAPTTGTPFWEATLPAPARHLATGSGVVVAVLDDGRVVALDARRGALLWEAAESTADAVAITSDLVVIAADTAGTVTALDTRTGAVRWTTALGETADIALLADGERVVAVTAVAVSLRALGEVISLDPRDGRVRWRYALPMDRAGRVPGTLTGGIVVLGNIGSDVQPLLGIGDDGRLRWSRALGPGTLRPSAHPPDGLVAITDGAVVALDPADGATLWSFDSSATTVAGHGDDLLVSSDHVVVAIDPPD